MCDERQLHVWKIKDTHNFFYIPAASSSVTGSSCHCPKQLGLPILGLALRRSSSFHPDLLGSRCHIRSASTQRTTLMGATRRDSKMPRSMKPPDMWVKKPPWKDILWPSPSKWRQVDQDETPRQALPGFLTYKTVSKAKVAVLSH